LVWIFATPNGLIQ